VLISLEVHLHNTPPSLLTGVLQELKPLQDRLTNEEAPYAFRICMWEAARLCGSTEPEPEKLEGDIEDEESEDEKATGAIKREKMET
jgi:hypothetical protein